MSNLERQLRYLLAERPEVSVEIFTLSGDVRFRVGRPSEGAAILGHASLEEAVSALISFRARSKEAALLTAAAELAAARAVCEIAGEAG